MPNPNPNPNFRNQDLSLPPIPKSQLGRRSRSDIGKSVIIFGGYNGFGPEREPTLMEDGEKFKWYSIPVPDDEAEAEAEAEKKLSPFSVVELPQLHSFVALKSSIYCLSNYTTETWIFDGCWKLGPQMNVRRFAPHTIVLSGKLYVLGGLYEDAREEYIWMEVLNPKRRAWRPLPNPPLRISSFGMVSVALERTKQIIVSAFLRGDSKFRLCYSYDSCVVYIYNVRTCCWTELEPPTINLRCGSPITRSNRAVVGADDTLYWASLNEDDMLLVVHAYCLYKNEWFEGFISPTRIIGMKEVISYMNDPTPFHLGGTKFCLLFQSYIPHPWKPGMRISEMKNDWYLHSVVFDFSLESDPEEDFGDLHISVVSTQTYRLDHSVRLNDAVLMDGGAFNRTLQKKPKLCAD
ncbi:uncharacterized protein LOC126705901 [Quercus robur]|uniref:uncharacterized protein LOC126705901 n=1 Tax=Quercus robur TaxID=38942 RepID=UPI002161DBA5|nr:uncharacterized protein LOC126705901 [Quercus robur]